MSLSGQACQAAQPATPLPAVLANGRLVLPAGKDDETGDPPTRGAAGVMAASAHQATGTFVQWHRLMQTVALAQARALWRHLQPLTAAAFARAQPGPGESGPGPPGPLAERAARTNMAGQRDQGLGAAGCRSGCAASQPVNRP